MSCLSTNAILRIFSDDHDPEYITRLMRLNPTDTRVMGEIRVPERPESKNPTNAWLLESDNEVKSTDTRQHINWILQEIEGRERVLAELRSSGARIDICCTWESSGQGGPLLDPQQLRGLASFDLFVWWEVWFGGDE